MTWQEDSEWERNWWGNCANTLREELLQIEYAKRMGLVLTPTDRTPYNIDMGGKSVIDIGGGPCSLLLKCSNVRGVVCEPCRYPSWTIERYRAAEIEWLQQTAETLRGKQSRGRKDDGPGEIEINICGFDEAWIYNVLQHTEEPALVIANAKYAAQTIRIFEYIEAGISPGHPHNLTEAQLNEWLGGKGTVEDFREHGAVGKVYYGVFET